MAVFISLNPPKRPSGLIKERSSFEVWYSLYSPYFVLINEQKGKSTPGLEYCL